MYGNQRNGSRGERDPGEIPPRWLHCPRKSELIEKLFLAFKTPLSSKFDGKVPIENRFTPEMLIKSAASAKIDIGLWIDLTNTNRFYSKDIVENEGIKYVKLNCRGHGEAPSEDSVYSFTREVTQFVQQNPLKKVAVHCTHGFNRTGFMICSYLESQVGHSIDYATAMFKRHRAPGIYKQDYLRELFSRYGDEDDTPTAPELPDWHTESDDSGGAGSSNGGRGGKKEGAKFMDGVPQVTTVTAPEKLKEVRNAMREMCGSRRKDNFPGLQPVSMSRENILMLGEQQYYVSWKADGTRYMMYIGGKGEIYFADRDNNIFHAPDIEFKDKYNVYCNLKDTLLDGEMVIDVDKSTGAKRPRYLVYDAVRVNGKDVKFDDFYLRWERINTDIIRPRNEAARQGLFNKEREPFSIRRKDFWEVNAKAVEKIMSEGFQKSLGHEPDGLIFQPNKLEYVCGRCDKVLKWKPPHMNSIDYKMKVEKEGGEGILPKKICALYVGGLDRVYNTMKYTKKMEPYNNKIIECAIENRQWVFMRERTDKSFPNHITTADAVMNTIMNPVTESNLTEYVHNHGYRKPDEVLMPPPQQHSGGPPVFHVKQTNQRPRDDFHDQDSKRPRYH